jgi:phosphonate transport system permease protein
MLLIWSWEGADMRPLALFKDSANMAVFAREFFPPNFHDWRIYLDEMVITIHIAIWGTVLAVSAPFRLAYCAPRTLPHLGYISRCAA